MTAELVSHNASLGLSRATFDQSSRGHAFLLSQITAQPSGPKLLSENAISTDRRKAYRRLRGTDEKNAFRRKVDDILGLSLAPFAGALEQDGGLFIRSLASEEEFARLVVAYDRMMHERASVSTIHAYRNLREEPQFLMDRAHEDVLFHPLLLALLAYRIGRPARLVDARAKDTWPMDSVDQDNQPHIDNSPFGEEYKVLLLWEKGTTRGPTGQNFVIAAGTHHLVRTIPTEDGSVFVTARDLDEELFGNPHLPGRPFLAEATDDDPLTAVFWASCVVHHRYRRPFSNRTRSCIILAFHDREDNPGSFFPAVTGEVRPLTRFILAPSESDFLDLLVRERATILAKADELAARQALVRAHAKRMSDDDAVVWRQTVLHGKRVQDRKPRLVFDRELAWTELLEQVTEIMFHDKHGGLDLILYPDGHEEIRKHARNRIREMSAATLRRRAEPYFARLTAPCDTDLLGAVELARMAGEHVDILGRVCAELPPEQQEAARSAAQLAHDLCEAVVRCTSMQTLRSTTLFLFWTAAEIAGLLAPHPELTRTIDNSAQRILQHYVASVAFDDASIPPASLP